MSFFFYYDRPSQISRDADQARSDARNLWGTPDFSDAHILPCNKEKASRTRVNSNASTIPFHYIHKYIPLSSIGDGWLGPECSSAGFSRLFKIQAQRYLPASKDVIILKSRSVNCLSISRPLKQLSSICAVPMAPHFNFWIK